MNEATLNDRLLKIGEKVKAKGWQSAQINIFVSYLAVFDREPSILDPMIYCRPSINSSLRDGYSWKNLEFVQDGFDSKSVEQALEILEKTVENMPTMEGKLKSIEEARSKLDPEERKLLGI
jgi:hypothetical protein